MMTSQKLYGSKPQNSLLRRRLALRVCAGSGILLYALLIVLFARGFLLDIGEWPGSSLWLRAQSGSCSIIQVAVAKPEFELIPDNTRARVIGGRSEDEFRRDSVRKFASIMVPAQTDELIARFRYFRGTIGLSSNPIPGMPEPDANVLMFPAWILLAGASILLSPLLMLGLAALRGRRRRLAGLCLACGYDLRGNCSGACSECGGLVK